MSCMLWGRREEPPPPRPRPAMAVTVTLKTLQQQTFKIRMEPHETVRPRRSPPAGGAGGAGLGMGPEVAPPPIPSHRAFLRGGSRPSRDSPESAMELGEGGGAGSPCPPDPPFCGGTSEGRHLCAPRLNLGRNEGIKFSRGGQLRVLPSSPFLRGFLLFLGVSPPPMSPSGLTRGAPCPPTQYFGRGICSVSFHP